MLNTLTESAARLCTADLGLVFQQDGDVLRLVANFGVSREAERYWLEHPVPVGRGSTSGRALLEGRAIRIPDVLADPEYRATRYQELAGYRSTLSVPLLRDGTMIGAQERLEKLTWEGAAKRYPAALPDNVATQLRHELNLIERLG